MTVLEIIKYKNEINNYELDPCFTIIGQNWAKLYFDFIKYIASDDCKDSIDQIKEKAAIILL